MSEPNNLPNVTGYTSRHLFDKLQTLSSTRKIPVARLIGYLVDNEFMKEPQDRFQFNCELPATGDHLEYAYAEEATKILNFVGTLTKGAGLDVLMMLRFKIGVPDKEAFLAAFKECLDKGMIEAFIPTIAKSRKPLADDYYYYRLAGQVTNRSEKMADKEYKNYLRLQKKYQNMESE